ncbi:MAG: P-loop NTPase fold protein [Paracoccaceae bacterium]|nr:P-loop NTPase fold protein [Paracoccaceae bacterium]MDE2676231.1 P-loop NTPase fold protein [Paracoccaceae bacterium]
MSTDSFSEQDNNSNVDLFGESGKDLLQRNITGDLFSKLMQSFENPRVVALDGSWGTGKTWFLKWWGTCHMNKFADTTVVYFDAFAHDYISDPLPALVSALEGKIDKDILKKIEKAAFKLVKPLAQKVMDLAAPGSSEVLPLFGEFIKALTDENEYWNNEKERMEGIGKFRTALKALASTGNGKKLIFVVDELDRCRPDYALEVLEVIKHFFSVDNVHFVLGVNYKALEDMVSVRYGAEDYATEYLEKFIQIKLSLPNEIIDGDQTKQNVLEYLDHLCQEMQVPKHIGSTLKKQVGFVSRANPISLRQIQHIVSAVLLVDETVLKMLDTPNRSILYVMNDLIISRVVRNDIYQKFLTGAITEEDLLSYYGEPDFKSVKTVDGKQRIPPYNKSQIWWQYHVWLYLSQQPRGEFPEDSTLDQNDKNQIEHDLLNSLMDADFPDVIVKKILHDWLDPLQFFKSSGEKVS